MLFDLKGKRKRFIQVTYVALAILFGVGLVGFGIGGATQGGLFDALSGGGGGGGSQSEDALVNRYQDQVRRNPKKKRAWVSLARAEYTLAVTGDNYDQNTQQFSEDGRKVLARAARAWERYLALDPKKPDANAAPLMVRAYLGLNKLDKAVRAQEIVTEARPSSNAFSQLAVFAYAAGRNREGDLAGQEAVRRAPKDQRNLVRSDLKQAKKQAQQAKKEARLAAKVRRSRQGGPAPGP
jgi:hypothetical protein